jgi:hypothetical protein
VRHRLTAVFAAGLLAAPVAASPLETFGVGARGSARGVVNSAGTDDLWSVFYNAAGLAEVRTTQFGVSGNLNLPHMVVDLDRRGGEGVVREAQGQTNMTIGFASPLAGRFAKRLVLGMLLEAPSGLLVRARNVDPATPHWLLLDGYADVFVFQGALALRLNNRVDLSVGFHNHTGLRGLVDLEVDTVNKVWVQRQLDFEFTGIYGPTAGFKARAGKFVLGAVYRSSLQMDYLTIASLKVDGLDAGMDLVLRGTGHYIPATLGFGVEWRNGARRIEIGGQLKRWSGHPDPSLDASIDLSGEDLEQLGLGAALDVPDPILQPRIPPNFSDVLNVGLGGQWPLGKNLLMVGSLAYHPTPVPAQTERTNYIDADAVVTGAALCWAFADPFGAFSQPLTLGVSGQTRWFLERRTIKSDAVRDPVGDWTAHGGHTSLMLTLSGAL